MQMFIKCLSPIKPSGCQKRSAEHRHQWLKGRHYPHQWVVQQTVVNRVTYSLPYLSPSPHWFCTCLYLSQSCLYKLQKWGAASFESLHSLCQSSSPEHGPHLTLLLPGRRLRCVPGIHWLPVSFKEAKSNFVCACVCVCVSPSKETKLHSVLLRQRISWSSLLCVLNLF